MNINSKKGWETLKKVFLESDERYLCHASKEFADLWWEKDNRIYLREQASRFLETMPSWNVRFEVLPCDSLFVKSSDHKENSYKSMFKSIRLDFIDYMIQISTNE